MNMVYASAADIPNGIANSVHVVNICSSYYRLGHEVTLLGRPGSTAATQEALEAFYGVPVEFKVRLRPGLGVLGRAVRLVDLLSLKPDLVHARDLMVGIGALRLGVPTILEVHTLAPHTYSHRLLKRVRPTDALVGVVAITHALRDDLLAYNPALAGRVHVLPDGAPTPLGTPTPILPPSERFRVGYTGHLYEGRGIELLLAAAAQLPEFEFHLVGGTPEDVERWSDRRTGDNVYLHGHRPPAEMPSWLASFDVLAAPYQRRVAVAGGGDTSRWMSPLKVFEYMASGKAIVASDLPAIREVLHDDRNCLLTSPDSVEDWVAAFRRLASDASLRTRIAESALAELRQDYTWDARAQRVIDLFVR